MTADSSEAVAPHPVQRVASRASVASDYGYPHGHLGHLSDYQADQLEAFKKVCEERGLYKPGPPPSHYDAVLLRFLRARRWVVEDAFKQFKDTEDWRAANDIDVLYHTIELDAYEQSRRLYPQWTGRRDRRGIPVYLFEVKALDSKTIAEYEKQGREQDFTKAKWDGTTPRGMLRLFALYENLTRFNQPLCTQLQDREFPYTPITMSTNIVDISGVSLRQFWNLKSHMQAASQLATAHYPETLDRIFIIGAPVFFSTVWGWIKRWFDPITVSKIFILSPSEVKSTLEGFIEPHNIPKKYGGQLDFNWGDTPTADPAWDSVVEWENGFTNFPSGPMIWQPIDGGKRFECIGIGHDKGKERKVRICTILRTYPREEAEESSGSATPAPVPATGAPVSTEESYTPDAVPAQAPATTAAAAPPPAAGEAAVTATPEATKPAITEGDELEKLKITDDKANPDALTPAEVSEKTPATAANSPPAVPTTIV